MCDFFSAIIRAPDTVYHDPTNSHSDMVASRGWRENTSERIRFWEFEWAGVGPIPEPSKLLRNSEDAPKSVLKAAVKLAEDLSAALAGTENRLWKHSDVRWRVATRTTDEKILAKLAKDPDANVRWRVAYRTTDEKILAKLAHDTEADVRRRVAFRTTDQGILAKLADDPDASVRWRVAIRKGTT